MITTILPVVLSVLMIGLALWLYLVYTSGNAWYRSNVGRALVTLAGSIVFIQIFSLFRRLLSWPSWTSDIEQGLIIVALFVLCVAFQRERRYLRRVDSAQQDHRIEREPS
jgi:chromate transport protein ChrA